MYSLKTLSAINFEISSHCNSKCPQCPRFDLKGFVQKDLKLQHLSIELIRKIPLSAMPNLKEISFIGNFGDPLMHPELDHILNFFSEKKIIISTNASLRDDTWWQNLGKRKNVTVIFCIDGLEDTHHLYRRNTSFEKILHNSISFIKAGGQARWQFIVFKHNEHQINEAKTLSKKLGFIDIRFIYSNRFDTNSKFKVYDKGKYLYTLEKGSTQTLLRERLNSANNEKFWKELNKQKGEIICRWSEEKNIYIHSDGSVYPCCMIGNLSAGRSIEKLLLKKIIKEEALINLNNHSFEKILNCDVFTKKLPSSFSGRPFSHPTCIEWCNNHSGKFANKDLNSVNI